MIFPYQDLRMSLNLNKYKRKKRYLEQRSFLSEILYEGNLLLFSAMCVFYVIAGVGLYLYIKPTSQAKQEVVRLEDKKVKPIFANKTKSDLEKRKEAAKDLKNFLRGQPMKPHSRDVLNRKLIQIGIEVQKDSSVTVMSDEVWAKAFATLKKEEIIDTSKIPKVDTDSEIKIVDEDTKIIYADDFNQSSMNTPSRKTARTSPQIDFNNALEEEEEEPYNDYKDLTEYQRRVKKRADKVKHYLFYTFNRATNHTYKGNRDTVVNKYLDDTISHYRDKVNKRESKSF